MKKQASIALGLAVTVLFLFLAVRNVLLRDLAAVFARAQWGWIVPMAVVGALDFGIRARRWQILLAHVKAAPFWLLFKLETIGLSINNILFLRLGELARAALAGRELELPVATVLASVVVERALDVSALLAIFIASASFSPELVSPRLRWAAAGILAAALGALALLVVAEGYLKPGGSWERALRRSPKAHNFVERLALGAQALRRPRAAAAAFGLSLALWLMDASLYWLAAFALGLDRLVSYQRSILILSWAGAGSALPAAPGAIGTFEAAVKAIVESMGAAADQALAYAFFTHMVGYLMTTVVGLACLYSVGLTLAHVKEALAKK